ncbi:SRPBCC family protein [Chitinimonas lacunae]|uniref:SRPBCC family protein n=1 Tax=Chitinimonas lacunae TaxID=1963018 RepID=A0ABV8MNY9_9NEIS
MHFEHLIEINDPNNPMLTPLSVAQLWRGLIHRAESPGEFLDNLDDATITLREEGFMERQLRFGSLLVHDRIWFEPQRRVRYETTPSEQHGGGSLTMTIEQPEPGRLFLRFVYHTPLSEQNGGNEETQFIPYIKAAYRDADVHTVRVIREMAERGDLGM